MKKDLHRRSPNMPLMRAQLVQQKRTNVRMQDMILFPSARVIARQWKKGAIPPKWDGKAAERIVEQLERLLLEPR